MGRYVGKPFLRLLECYILNAIDQLSNDQRETLKKMESKLVDVYGTDQTWCEIVRAQMDLPESFPTQIRELWKKNLISAHNHGVTVNPEEFAIAFVDQNFPDVVS